MSETIVTKAALRAASLKARAMLGVQERYAAAAAIAGHAQVIAALAKGGTVSGFAAFGDELDTAPLLEALARVGVRLALPVVGRKGRPLIFRRWQPGDDTAPGPFGIPQPLPAAAAVEPDVFLVPLLVFDRRGYRVGYGGGFYDRTLAAARAGRPVLALGLAFSLQEVARVPAEDYDEPVDGVLTEREAMACSGGPGAAALPW